MNFFVRLHCKACNIALQIKDVKTGYIARNVRVDRRSDGNRAEGETDSDTEGGVR